MGNNVNTDLFKKFFRMKNPVSNALMVVLMAGLPFLLYLILDQDYGLYAIGAVTGILVVYLSLLYPKTWLTVFVLTLPVYIFARGDDISVVDVFTAVYYTFGLFIWFVLQILVFRKKIVHHIGDWIILFFFVVMIANAAVANFNDGDLMKWLREYALLFLTLYYFPVREYFSSKKDLKYLVGLLAFITVGSAFYQFYSYYFAATSDEVAYAYQLAFGLRINQMFFTSASLFGLVFAFGQNKKIREWLLMIYTVITFIGMFVSFSRTYWVFYFSSVILMFFYLPGNKKLLLLKYVGFVMAVMTIAILMFWRDNAEAYLQVVSNRFTSSTKGTKDISFIARQVEYAAAFEHIKRNPLGGNGLARQFSFHSPLAVFEKHTTVIHNGYIFFMYRVGLPLTLAYIFVLIYFTYKAFYLLSRVKSDMFLKNLILGSFISLLLVWAANLTSSQFAYRDGIIVISFVYALVDIVEKNLNKTGKNEKKIEQYRG